MLLGVFRGRGEKINHKRFLRIYREENLQIGKRIRVRRQLIERIRSETPEQTNERWSMDFMYDVLETKRSYRIFNVIDDCSRECLVCEVGRGFGGYDVARLLDEAIKRYGKPKRIRSDNGSEFRSHYMRIWSKSRGIELEFIEPGKPTQNAQVESFNGTLRDEELRSACYVNLNDAQKSLKKWRNLYNTERPHSSLGYATPSSRRPLGGDYNIESNNKSSIITNTSDSPLAL